MNLKNVEEKHADQPAEERATTYRKPLLPQLNSCGWKQLIFEKTG